MSGGKNSWNKESRHSSDLFAQNLRDQISAIKDKLERLTDAYLAEALELAEYQKKKNILMAEKKTIEEKLSDFERKGNHWLELMRNWIIEANQAVNLSKQENPSRMRDFLVSIGSNRRLAAGMLAVDFKNRWDFLAKTNAEARSAEATSSVNQIWWARRDSNRTGSVPRLARARGSIGLRVSHVEPLALLVRRENDVGTERLELSTREGLVPKTSAYTNSATCPCRDTLACN